MKKAAVLLLSIALSACNSSQDDGATGAAQTANLKIDVPAVKNIILARCNSCHSAKPTDDVFKVAPGGVILENIEQMQRSAARIYARAVITQTMPFMNKTQMTESERALVGQWIKAGAPSE